jgi:hypothetical protein
MSFLIDQNIKRVGPPALPTPPQEYSKSHLEQFNNVLRLYFNQLENVLRGIMATQTESSLGVYPFGSAGDAFGRARISSPFTLFDSQNRYADSGDFDTATATGGTSTFSTNTSSMDLAVTTTSGSEVLRESYRVFPYQPGKSLLIMTTFVMNAAKTDLRQRVGYFSTQNGVFVEQSDNIYMVLRSFVTGSTVDTKVAQENWNQDKLDGNGPSGFTLDMSKSQIFWTDLEWLGVGSVRCGFVINGQLIICHVFNNANINANVYMTTAILPVRYEITNTDTTASESTLKQICSTVISEGGYARTTALTVARMTSDKAVTTSFVPLVSIRLASGRLDAVVLPALYSALPTSNANYEIALIKNPTLTGASFAASGSSNVDFDLAATALSSGTIVGTTFIGATNQSRVPLEADTGYNFDLQLGRTIGGTSDVITLAARTLAGTNSIIGALEFYDLT